MTERKKNLGIAACLLAISMLVSAFIIHNIKVQSYRQEHERISYITETQASKLQSAIGSLFQKTQTLQMLVIQGGGRVENFDTVAAELLDNSAIRSIQLAPKGVVSQVYPLEGNEEAFGDLFADPARAKEAILARDTGKLTMSGPFELTQGGFGVVGRQPVYLPDAEGKPSFWGFAIIVLDLPDALRPADLDRLVQEGYEYKLHRTHPDTGEIQIFAESSANFLTNPVDVLFDVPNAKWTISVAPKNGWLQYSDLFLKFCVGVAISVLIALLAYLVLSMNAQRRAMQKLSVTDTLTGLYNRRQVRDVIMERCEHPGYPFTVCYIDINDFKSINDTFGHDVGDAFLIECARRLERCLDVGEQLFRVGGDEFLAIMNYEHSPDHAESCTARLNCAFDESFRFGKITIESSISVGFASFPENGTTLEALIKKSDTDMYNHKSDYKAAKRALS